MFSDWWLDFTWPSRRWKTSTKSFRTRRRTRPSTWRLFSKFSAQAKNCKVEELLFIVISSNIITISNFRFSVPSNLIKLAKNGGCFTSNILTGMEIPIYNHMDAILKNNFELHVFITCFIVKRRFRVKWNF